MRLLSNGSLRSGCVQLPASKSISNRVLIINNLAEDASSLENLADCDDTNVLRLWIEDCPEVIDVGAAGTAMRFSTALLCLQRGTHLITGTDRMKNRPVGILVDALRQLGASIDYVEKEGFPPLRIIGNPDLDGGSLTIRGDVSSQFISALLMIAPVMKKGLTLTLQGNVLSRPYIDLTIKLMQCFGADVKWLDDRRISVPHGTYNPRPFRIENDWTAASYWYELVALADNPVTLEIPGLMASSMQGDAMVAYLFRSLGVQTSFTEIDGVPMVVLEKTESLTDTVVFNLSDTPDLAQTLVVTCCLKNMPFRFTGLSTLRIKETDRLSALKNELAKLCYDLQIIGDDCIQWNGERIERANASPAEINTYNDHRMAMAFAPAVLKTHELVICNPQVVTKSYPHFWQELFKMIE